jgi:bifunctional non-homologous end joining protein LigD
MAKLSEYKRKRDFTKTSEPSGGPRSHAARGKLHFVIQKHAASHLHYDFRLELDGVMKSWAVPKGPSVNTSVKRLAMEVEDHPIEYNKFEGTIPQGEYGGGTVMLWDRGTYTADEAGADEDVQKVLKREYHAGKMSITLFGERLRGSWALVRTDAGPKPKWLLIKHRDEFARKYEATEEFITSVVTDRTMEEIAGGRRVWHSNRGPGSGRSSKPAEKPSAAAVSISPMRATSARRLPGDARIALPWRGGERVLAFATEATCVLMDASGRDVTSAHSDIADALAGLSRRAGHSFILDAEIAEADGNMYVLDLLFSDDEALVAQPWSSRRKKLDALFRSRRVKGVRLDKPGNDLDASLDAASHDGWRGIFAIDPESEYSPGKRTRAWLMIGAD